jgi:hypothetical protein
VITGLKAGVNETLVIDCQPMAGVLGKHGSQ